MDWDLMYNITNKIRSWHITILSNISQITKVKGLQRDKIACPESICENICKCFHVNFDIYLNFATLFHDNRYSVLILIWDYEILNTLLKKDQSLNIKVDKDYEIVHERRMT